MAIRMVQNSLVGGELSPAIHGRHDISAYFKGAARIDNFMVLKTGGARKRWSLRSTDESAGDALPQTGAFRMIPYRYDRETCAVLLLSTPLSGNSTLRLIDKARGWTLDPRGAMELDFRVEPADMKAVRATQVGDTLLLCSGSSNGVRKILIDKQAFAGDDPPFAGLAAANHDAGRAFYSAAEWDYDYCPLGISFREYHVRMTPSPPTPFETPGGVMGDSGLPYKYAATPVFADGHQIFPENAELESRMVLNTFRLNPSAIPQYPTFITLQVSFWADRLPVSVKLWRSDSGTYGGLRHLASLTLATATPAATSVIGGRTVNTYNIAQDNWAQLTSTAITADRAAYGWERTASYHAVGVTGSAVTGGTDASRVAVSRVGNAGLPDATRRIALSVATDADATPDTINVYRALLDLGATGDAVKIAAINTVAGTVTTAAGTSAIEPEEADGLRTYTILDDGTHIAGGGVYTPPQGARFDWTNYSAEVSAFEAAAKPTEPAGLTSTVAGMTGTYARKYSAQGVKASVWSAPVLSTANGATTWTAGATITLVATFPATRGYDRVTFGKMSAGVYGEIATVYPGDTGWVEAAGTVTVTVVDDNIMPSTPIYSQARVTEAQAVTGSDIDIIQQRVAVSGGNGIPFSLQFSAAGDLANFWASRPAQLDDGFSLSLSVNAPADIRHMLAFRDYLLCFTDGGVYRVRGGADGFSFSSAVTDRLNDIGCAPAVPPVETSRGVLFVAADLRSVYELKYDLLESDSVIPIERSVLADHLTEGRTITHMAHQRYPEGIVWIALSDGGLTGFTYQPENEVYAWHRHTLPDGCAVLDAVSTETVTDGAADGKALSDLLFAVRGPDGKTRLAVFSAARVDTVSGSDVPVRGVIVTLRPELPDRNVQGIPKTVTDCLIRVRDTARLSVRNAAGGTSPVEALPGGGEPYTGNVKIMPEGLIDDDGQMEIVSESGPCEIQMLVWKVEF